MENSIFEHIPKNNKNVSDISIVILKNLIFNENEIKAGRILTFFPTKTIQVGKWSHFTVVLYLYCRLRESLVNYWWQTHLKNILLIKSPGILIGITTLSSRNNFYHPFFTSDSPQCRGGLRSSYRHCSPLAPGPFPTSPVPPDLGCWVTRYLYSRTPIQGEQLSSGCDWL